MTYFVTTSLGREVPIEDRTALHGDTILKVLHDAHMSPFNPTDAPVPMRALCTATGLTIDDANQVMDALVCKGLAERVTADTVRIAADGVLWVRNVGAQLTLAGSYR